MLAPIGELISSIIKYFIIPGFIGGVIMGFIWVVLGVIGQLFNKFKK